MIESRNTDDRSDNSVSPAPPGPAKLAWQLLTAEDEGRVCKDIPDSACREQPQSFFIHLLSLSLTKSADTFVNPKLILSWILSTSGAPTYFIGLLVPVREAGALLPQLFTAVKIRSLKRRKFVWAAGSFIQGVCAIGLAITAYWLEGFALGLSVVILLGGLALARSLCSVSYKDVLGKTVDKSRRGTVTGSAGTLAALIALAYAGLVVIDWFDKTTLLCIGLLFGGVLWLIASLFFLRLNEERGATSGGKNAISFASKHFSALFSDRQLQLFILSRALLMSTALAPPFLVALNADIFSGDLSGLGWLLFASSLASFCSSYVWGRLADKSSRRVLILSAFLAAFILSATVAAHYLGLSSKVWLLPLLLFGLMIAHEGVRLGRSTHLVDMANAEQRATYTALSNTIIGVLLAIGGLFSVISHHYGNIVVLIILACMGWLAILTALKLEEVQ